ncbi:MAG: tRNA-uridine aminocarboxypropyltransferase [Rariglobus sp.]
MCYRCFWPKQICWCPSITPMETRTHFVFLMHPKEFKQEKAGTGRLTHLCLGNSEIQMGIAFDDHEAVQEIINDPRNFTMLLYPSARSRNLSNGDLAPADLGDRRLVVLLLDATWALAKKMLRLSPSLQRLPRIMFTPSAPSRYVIKQQPVEGCLSTLEASHELLMALQRSGLDQYPLPEQLLGLFARMQDYQLRCARDPSRDGYRRSPYSAPSERVAPKDRTNARRTRLFNLGAVSAPPAEKPAE